jgi:hypothetical protein
MAFVRGRTTFEERIVKAVVPLTAPSLTAGSFSGRVAWAHPAPTASAPDTDCASVLSLAGGAAGAGPCPAPVGSAGGPQGVGVKPASAAGVVRDCPCLGSSRRRRGGEVIAPGDATRPRTVTHPSYHHPPTTDTEGGESIVTTQTPRPATTTENPRPETFDLAIGAHAPRAKTKSGEDAGRAHSGAMGPTEDIAGRRFAAVDGGPNREIERRGPVKEENR